MFTEITKKLSQFCQVGYQFARGRSPQGSFYEPASHWEGSERFPCVGVVAE